ncbi:hypothetical protein KDH83_06560 [Achromobacter sp. Marseille-Q0513]|uniref:hypothetical protein n=1 Tax=Achromobacter sp. Marseille-Q0513 TaxID=2829161 RepID=UPI001BA32809|nr:hypothetical protein [Achromobacter sp. Marseille-Q0513]MBR8652973.1 hypothetical protein [Achromobacter sp. Marseille-Q0513]
MLTVLGLLTAPFAIAVFIWIVFVAAPWAWRMLHGAMKHFAALFVGGLMRRLEPISAARSFTFSGLYSLGLLGLAISIRVHLDVMVISLLLTGYIVAVAALSASLIAKLLDSGRIWGNAATKICLFVVPIVVTYLAKGYGAWWVGEILGADARNAPMAHAAATGFLMVACVAMALTLVALAVEVILICALGALNAGEKTSVIGAWKILRIPRKHRDWRGRIYLQKEAKKWGVWLLLLCTFTSCLAAFNASTWIFTRFGKIVLSAAVFEFDAAPAGRCVLMANEKTLSEFSVLKTLFVSGQQEKAILLERGGNLLEPVALKKLKDEVPDTRTLKMGRVAACYKVD